MGIRIDNNLDHYFHLSPTRISKPSMPNQLSLQALIEKCEEQDVDGFTEEVKRYDQISRLDSWYTSRLLAIKKQLNDGDDLR